MAFESYIVTKGINNELGSIIHAVFFLLDEFLLIEFSIPILNKNT